MLFVKKHSYIKFKLKDFSPSTEIIWDIVKVGIPASMSMIIMALGQGVFNKILINYSPNAVAAYQVAGRLAIFAIAGGLTTLVGMFYGAKKLDELNFIVKYGISRAFFITLISSAFVYYFADIFSGWFTEDTEIISISVGFLRRVCLIYPLVAIAITSGRVMQGLGKGMPVLIITTIRVVGISAPLALYFSYYLNKPIQWNWYAIMISATIAFVIAVIWVKYELKKINRVKGQLL